MDRRLTLADGQRSVAVADAEVEAWEKLVTEGHVRAARLRWIQPWLIALGVGLILIGANGQYRIRIPEPRDDRGFRLLSAVQDLKNVPLNAFRSMPPIPATVTDARTSLLPEARLQPLADALAASLDKSERLPANINQTPVRIIDAAGFWSRPWPFGALLVQDRGNTKAVGIVVNSGNAQFLRAQRWFGIYKRINGRWTYVSVEGPFFVNIEGHPTVSVDDLPITVAGLLP